jgi:hypothetical protein
MTCSGYAPLASPTFIGTVTLPDASTITSAGQNNVAALGIGEPVQSGNLLAATLNTNGAASFNLTNPNAGANAQASYGLSTGTGGSIYPTALSAFGSGWTGNVSIPANSAALTTSEPNGLQIATNTTPNKIWFGIGGTTEGTFDTSGFNAGAIAATSSMSLGGFPMGTVTSWTPTIIGGTTNPTVTYVAQIGKYARVGAQFSWYFYVGWSALSGGSGSVQVGGFPLIQSAVANEFPGGSVYNFNGVTMGTGYTVLACQIASSTSTFLINEYGSGVGAANLPLTGLAAGGGQLLCSGWGNTSG